MDIKVGQVWHDKDKRRDTTIEIIDESVNAEDAVGRNIKTGEQKVYRRERLLKRWELVNDVPYIDPDTEIIKELDKEYAQEPVELTREQWLTKAVELLTPLFNGIDLDGVTPEVPRVRVSVGWPGGRGPKSNVVGQCWKQETAEDSISQIFISPVVGDAEAVLATLLHELIHASDNGASGHRGHFKRTAQALGFLAPFTSATVNHKPNADDVLKETLIDFAEKLGPYPHSPIKPDEKPKVQKTFMLKIVPGDCDECDPEYKLRMTEKWLEEAGAPLCPHGIEMVEG